MTNLEMPRPGEKRKKFEMSPERSYPGGYSTTADNGSVFAIFAQVMEKRKFGVKTKPTSETYLANSCPDELFISFSADAAEIKQMLSHTPEMEVLTDADHCHMVPTRSEFPYGHQAFYRKLDETPWSEDIKNQLRVHYWDTRARQNLQDAVAFESSSRYGSMENAEKSYLAEIHARTSATELLVATGVERLTPEGLEKIINDFVAAKVPNAKKEHMYASIYAAAESKFRSSYS